jgi:hypothetical protein
MPLKQAIASIKINKLLEDAEWRLIGKEQAPKFARFRNCGYAILSNSNIHYFWDIDKSDPYIIWKFPTQKSDRSGEYHSRRRGIQNI